jgi:PAS domain S-box-containing protein
VAPLHPSPRSTGQRAETSPPDPSALTSGAAWPTRAHDSQLIVESDSELVCRYLPDTTLTYVNDAYCQYFGKTREELLGRRFLELIPDPARPAAREHVAALLGTPRVVADEHEVVLPDGSTAWQQWIDLALVDASGQVVELTAIGRDVTARKRAEEALVRREAQLAEAQRLAQIGSWEWDLVTEQVTWSDELYRIWGVEPSTYTPTPDAITMLIHPDDRPRALAEIDAAFRQGQSYECEYRIVRPDGEIRYLHTRGNAVVDETGRTIRMHGTKQDITAQKRADERFRALIDVLQASIDALPAHVAILDEHGTILEANAAWRRFAADQEEGPAAFDVGVNYLATCDASARRGRWAPKTIAAGLRAVIAGEQDTFHQVVYGRPIGDPQAWFQVRVTRFHHGDTLRLVVTREDVTEIKRAGDLTPRQREIVRLLAEGGTSKSVAAALRISVKTVATHRAAIMRKLALTSVAALVRYAIRNRIVEP